MLSVIIVLVLVGVGLFLLEKYVPMDGAIKTIIRVVAILFVIVYVLRAFGLLSGLGLNL